MLLVQQPGSTPVARFTASGELDVFGALALRRGLHRAAGAGDTDLRVDLEGVTFVDASALGLLARTWRDLAAESGTTISLVSSSRSLRAMRRVAGLTKQLPDVAGSALRQYA